MKKQPQLSNRKRQALRRRNARMGVRKAMERRDRKVAHRRRAEALIGRKVRYQRHITQVLAELRAKAQANKSNKEDSA